MISGFDPLLKVPISVLLKQKYSQVKICSHLRLNPLKFSDVKLALAIGMV